MDVPQGGQEPVRLARPRRPEQVCKGQNKAKASERRAATASSRPHNLAAAAQTHAGASTTAGCCAQGKECRGAQESKGARRAQGRAGRGAKKREAQTYGASTATGSSAGAAISGSTSWATAPPCSAAGASWAGLCREKQSKGGRIRTAQGKSTPRETCAPGRDRIRTAHGRKHSGALALRRAPTGKNATAGGNSRFRKLADHHILLGRLDVEPRFTTLNGGVEVAAARHVRVRN